MADPQMDARAANLAENYDPNAQAPPTVGPTPPGVDRRKALNSIPMGPDDVKKWWSRIKRSQERRKTRADNWDILLREYLPKVTEGAEAIKVNTHFRNVHTKIGQIFVRSPEVRCSPKGPAMDQIPIVNPLGQMQILSPADIIPIKQEVINQRMGPDMIDGLSLMDECLFDQMAWAGISFVKTFYRAVIKQVPEPVTQPDPNFQPPPQAPGSTLGIGPQPKPPEVPVIDPATGQPAMRMADVVIFEEWDAVRISPKKALLDDRLKSCRFRKQSRWIGHEFFMSKMEVIREFGLDEKDFNTVAKDDLVFEHEEDSGQDDADADLVRCVEIFYYCSKFISTELHPQKVYQLILIEGMETTVVHRPSPDQTFDNQGKLTPNSLPNLPIEVGVLRVLADSPYPPADSAFTNAQVKHVNTHRQQSVRLRDAAIGKYIYDTEALDQIDRDKIQNGTVGDWVGVKGGAMAQGLDKIIVPLAQLHSTPDDWRLASILQKDIDETLGISANQAGSPMETVRSATEIADVAANSAGRQKKEQARALAFYVAIVRNVDILLARYMDETDYIEVVGEDGTKRMLMWNGKVISGPYSYDIKPDSQLDIDVARDRQQKLSFYNLAAADPLVNRSVVLRDLARDFGYDPAKIILSPDAQMSQPPHGGPANKHESENSGQKPGGEKGDNRQERNPREGSTGPSGQAGPPQRILGQSPGVH